MTFAAGLAVAALSASAAACDDDGGGDEEAEADVQASIDAINQASLALDTDEWLKYVTPNAMETVFYTTEEQAREDPMTAYGSESEDDFFVASEITVDGETAEAVEALGPEDGPLLAPSVILLVKEDDVWKIDGARAGDAEAPDGAVTVSVVMREFEFEIDDDAFEAGKPVLFEVENDGEQAHHFGFFKLDEGVNLEEALASEEDEAPEGITDLGFIGPMRPGDDGKAAFTENLEPGRYAFVCFLPDESAEDPEEAPPHFALGMVHEVTVE
jgi:hypothetical protein